MCFLRLFTIVFWMQCIFSRSNSIRTTQTFYLKLKIRQQEGILETPFMYQIEKVQKEKDQNNYK